MSGRRREELHQEKFYVECLTAITLSHRRNIQIINLFCSYPRIEKSNLRIFTIYMHRFQTRKSNRKIKQNVKKDHVKMKILRCCTHRWEFSLPFLAMRLKPGVRVSSELALHGSFGDVSWKEMRPSV